MNVADSLAVNSNDDAARADSLTAGLAGVAALVLIGLAGKSQLPSWFPASGTLVMILAGVWTYATGLGAAGAAVSGAFARKEPVS